MKKVLFFALITSLSILQLNSQGLTDSLVVYYPFDGDAIDYSDNELHGTINGPANAPDRNGNENSALYFDGFDDVIDFPLNELLNPELPVTISFWIKAESLDVNYNRFFDSDYQYNNYSGFWMTANSGSVRISYAGNIGAIGYQYRRTKYSSGLIASGIWFHIVGIIRGPVDMDIFINGTNAGGDYEGSGPESLGYSNEIGKIGSMPGHTATPDPYFFWGTMDDFALWSRALSTEEITDLFNNGIETSSIGERTEPDFIISPNPAQDILYISLSTADLKIETIKLYDLTGKEMLSENNDNQVNISNFPDGLYLVQVTLDNGKTETRKILKK